MVSRILDESDPRAAVGLADNVRSRLSGDIRCELRTELCADLLDVSGQLRDQLRTCVPDVLDLFLVQHMRRLCTVEHVFHLHGFVRTVVRNVCVAMQ
ncbi:MAG TPA: hypothetical protein VFW73_02060 [Lacipirellulaceae bacterium]|nr:hypothetical protein [Lacipirellulaceae bacterium]